MSNEKENVSMAEALMKQENAGFHQSRSDGNNHYTVKNADGVVVAHAYSNDAVKATSEGAGIPWMLKK